MHTLTSRRDFAHIQASGRSRSHRLVVVRLVPNGLEHDRYGISTGRRLGGAVERNRVRRRIREIVRRMERPASGGSDILIVARPASVTADFGELRSALERLLLHARATGAVSGA